MGTKKFKDIVGDVSADRRKRIDEVKAEAVGELVAYQLAELRKQRGITQVELAEILGRTQASVSAMERASDNKLSTWWSAVDGMGGRLEVYAVFDDERIPIATDKFQILESMTPKGKGQTTAKSKAGAPSKTPKNTKQPAA